MNSPGPIMGKLEKIGMSAKSASVKPVPIMASFKPGNSLFFNTGVETGEEVGWGAISVS